MVLSWVIQSNYKGSEKIPDSQLSPLFYAILNDAMAVANIRDGRRRYF
jgi:hypothetical protein